MEKGKIYEVICGAGRNRDICQYTLNKNMHCTECSYARYRLREHIEQPEESIKEEPIQEEKQENGE